MILALEDTDIDICKLDGDGFNLLHRVIMNSNYPLVRLMLKLFPKFIFSTTEIGQTNLMLAVNQPDFDIINIFL